MASGVNSMRRRIATKSLFPDCQAEVTTSSTWEQGDFLAWVTDHIEVIPTSIEDGTNFLGIASNSVANGVLLDPYVNLTDTEPGPGALSGPEYGDVHAVIGKTGDTFTKGGLVYPSIGAGKTREVTSVAGALKAIGIYQGPTVTASAGQQIECLIGVQYPNLTLKF
jgi:hypothetical protein